MGETKLAAIILCMLGFALVPPVAGFFAEPYYIDLFTRIMVFGMAAVSLDLILGYGGMLSFNQAMYLGVGGYAVGILARYGVDNGFVQLAVAILASALVALVTGAISLRTTGVYFIMITLAFGQMFYFLGLSVEKFGGDEGLTINAHGNFGALLNFDNATVLYYFVLASLFGTLVLCRYVVASRFGMVIAGTKLNERRMRAVGFPTFRYKLAAFTLSGAICGFAGALLANQALFVSPAIMAWGRSGEIMVMVIMGGIQTLLGPVLGAVIYLVLEDVLSGLTNHWQIVLGPFLVLLVLFARQGVMGLFGQRAREATHG